MLKILNIIIIWLWRVFFASAPPPGFEYAPEFILTLLKNTTVTISQYVAQFDSIGSY